jgi:hypothetical protein
MTLVDISRSLATICGDLSAPAWGETDSTHVGELASVHLDVADVCLNLSAELLEVLDDGHLDGLAEIGVVVGDGSGLLADAVEDVLHAALAQLCGVSETSTAGLRAE